VQVTDFDAETQADSICLKLALLGSRKPTQSFLGGTGILEKRGRKFGVDRWTIAGSAV
jgi:hypothetical protein